ncbi:MAG: endonuclease/exonuclease/phosphatase family protein [Kofleriaceae bacterium]|nr:endonuclease/exonuclease/phosphatase family protein [Kofleriaceae bacterium]
MGVLPIVCALRVMTYNVNYGNPDPKATLDAIEKADADIVLLQEITSSWQRALSDRFARQYAHQSFRLHTRSAGGLAVLSKVPIKSEEILPSPERGWFPASRLVIETAFGALQILNVHLRPAIDGGSWIKGFMTTPPLRLREIETYFPKIAKDVPTIIAGDFNEDPSGTAVAFLEKKGFSRAATTGPTSWHYEVTNHGKTSDVLKMDIDHVMVDGGLVAKDGVVLDAGASDHRPVVVTVSPKS